MADCEALQALEAFFHFLRYLSESSWMTLLIASSVSFRMRVRLSALSFQLQAGKAASFLFEGGHSSRSLTMLSDL